MSIYNIAVLIVSALGVIAPLCSNYFTNKKDKEESEFYKYITLKEEKFVRRTRRKGVILLIIFIILNGIAIFNNSFYFLIKSEDKVAVFNVLVCIISGVVVLAIFVCKGVLIFIDIKWLDKKLNRCNHNVTYMDLWINSIIAIMGVVVLILIGVFYVVGADKEIIFITAWCELLLAAGIEAVLNDFISFYVKFRRWYHVDNICIRTKTQGVTYDNISNYKKHKEFYDVVYTENDTSVRVIVPMDEVVCVEHIINTEETYLDYMRTKNN